MKRFIRMICLVLAVCAVATMPVSATAGAGARGNAYIAAHDTVLEKITASQFRIWFDVSANATHIDKIGVTKIEVYRSPDQKNWTKMRTYSYTSYPEMMDYNSGSHSGYVTYSYATTGYYYKAYVSFFAGNSTGSGAVLRYTAILQM